MGDLLVIFLAWVWPALLAMSLAVWAIWWAIFADKARGRRRCPRCWHDLSRTPGLTCSECGLVVHAGAIVVAGNQFGRQGGHRLAPRAVALMVGASVGGAALFAVSFFLLRSTSMVAAVVVQVIATVGMPLAIASLPDPSLP